LSFPYTTPCQIFLPKILYACMSVSCFFAYVISQFMMTSIVIERWVAFIFFRKYESGYTKLGPVLIAGAVSISSILVFVLYNGQNFDGWYVNGRMFPLITYSRANTVLFIMLGANIICLILTIILHLLTPKRRIRMSLSSKFQRRENLIASKLFFWIATIQFTAYCCSQIALLYIRIYHSTDPMSPAYKENTFFNLYTLAMPVLSTFYFAKVKRQRTKDIRNHLNIKTIGIDGWANYLTMIQKQWK
uniref:Serpentine receptor class gamma n=1 Tax=Haemonchus contortus TaxID=6289 RepID=A0A7I4YP16_HAECO